MKNTVITARRKKIELLTLLACFIIGNLANLYAIISYETPFSEMLTSFFYVLAFSGVLYVFWTILRILFYGIRSLFLKKEMRPEDDQDSVT